MSNLSSQSPNMFSAVENPILNEAFAIAWRAVAARQADPANDPSPIVLQSRIASAILTVAAQGITDSTLMAKAAVERCASMRKLRTAS
jgi:hypothetical protein